ncbi:MAG: Slp family lipoprotein [Lysobacterales bacterium]
MKQFGLWLLPLALIGCATAPRPLQGEFTQVRPLDAARADGAKVRWGGSIIAVEPRAGETCFEVLGRELGSSARPRPTDTSDGRFLACRSGFYDPAVFKAGRDITVVGALAGTEVRKVGEFDYSYPRVTASALYLWPERSEVIVEHRASPFFFYSPFWYGYSRPIFIHRPHH